MFTRTYFVSVSLCISLHFDGGRHASLRERVPIKLVYVEGPRFESHWQEKQRFLNEKDIQESSQKRVKDNLTIVEISMTDKSAVLSIKNGATVNVHVVNTNGYLQADFSLRIQIIEDPDILQRDVKLL